MMKIWMYDKPIYSMHIVHKNASILFLSEICTRVPYVQVCHVCKRAICAGMQACHVRRIANSTCVHVCRRVVCAGFSEA